MSDESANRTGSGADEPDEALGPSERGRRLLDRARKSAPRRRPARRRTDPGDQPWSGPGPDARDPAPLSASVDALIRDRDWEETLRDAGILGRWPQLVGAEIADHCHPDRFLDGELTCTAESTAWAANLALMAPKILARLQAELGPGVVTRLRVHGPTAPDWRHGPLRVPGRGPRDTYG